jgi:hypothetical protein
MSGEAARQQEFQQASMLVKALVAADGTAAHPYAAQSAAGAPSDLTRSLSALADAAHYLCMLHGRYPGVIDHAATRIADNAARDWLIRAAEGFAAERAFLTQVSVAVGPLPSTAGQADTDTAIVQQRHSLDMLAQSDRQGCAIGAAVALVLDWASIRRILDLAAIRAGLEPRRAELPPVPDTLAVADALCANESIARAFQFGARQLIGQHRGLWDLLQARAAARAAS